MSAPVPARAVVASAPGWVRGPVWDTFWLQSPLWLLPLGAALSWGAPDAWQTPLRSVYFGLTLLFWIGHRFSSTWVAWVSPAYAQVRRAQPLRFVIVPVAAIVLVFLTVMDPAGVLPGTPLSRAAVIGVADYLLLTWHFSAQHFGVLSLYRARAGARAPWVRTTDRALAVGVGGVAILVAEIGRGLTTIDDAWMPAALQSTTVDTWASGLLPVGAAVTALITLGAIAAELARPSGSWPRAAYLLGLGGTALGAFVFDPFLYLVVWTTPHWLSAMGLASLVAEGRGPAPDRRAVRRFLLAIVALSIAFTPIFEVEASYGPEDRPAVVALGLEGVLTGDALLPWLVAFGLATAALHYLLDRAVWRFGDPMVRDAAQRVLRV